MNFVRDKTLVLDATRKDNKGNFTPNVSGLIKDGVSFAGSVWGLPSAQVMRLWRAMEETKTGKKKPDNVEVGAQLIESVLFGAYKGK